MDCLMSGLNALYEAAISSGDVWINARRFCILRRLGDRGRTFVFLVKEVPAPASDVAVAAAAAARRGNLTPYGSYTSDDGTYTMKKVLIESNHHLEILKEEVRIASLFSHPNLLPLLDYSIIAVKSQQGKWRHEAYLLFPAHLEGTLLDHTTEMQEKNELYSTKDVLQIFKQVCDGLKHLHTHDPPYAHNNVKPGNILIKNKKGQSLVAILMDFGSTRPARMEIHSDSEALELQQWAAEHCPATFRAPELWHCPSQAKIDERTDIWSLGCTLFAIMFGVSPFEYALAESVESFERAVLSANIKWPSFTTPPYPDVLHKFVIWMLQPQPGMRPHIDDIILHVDKLMSKYSS